jgi:5'-nucleotidase
MKRRTFIKKIGATTLLAGTGIGPLAGFVAPEATKVTLLHTNDMHSRIDPFPMDGGKYQGLGGVAKRAGLIKKIRQEEEHVLLMDAGDIFQGTPYFNFFGGEVEFKVMSAMGYDVATIGNHDFDGGIEGLHKQLPHANFPFVCCNYDFSDTIMDGHTQPYIIKQYGPVKIGIIGVGIKLEGLVPKNLTRETKYLDPIIEATRWARHLKKALKCHYIICLSHLGMYPYQDQVCDISFAQNSRFIDLIIGGHSHTFLDKPVAYPNKDGELVLIHQVGWGGIVLGRLDLFFEYGRNSRCVQCNNLLITS